MVDVTQRSGGAGETDPHAPTLGAGQDRSHFMQGAIHAREWQEMLANGVAVPPVAGTPVPVMYPGGPLQNPRPGVPTGVESTWGEGGNNQPVGDRPVVQGMHQDPRASEYNIGTPAPTGSNTNLGAQPSGRLASFGMGG